jgi:hypothetical protein
MLESVATVMRNYSRPWWVAGGWAVDLFLGEVTRPHTDIDVAVLRRDQEELLRFLGGWQLSKAVDGTLHPWASGEHLELPVHEIHARRNGTRLEFLLNEAAADQWLFRRNRTVSMPLGQLTTTSAAGIPSLCPEVVLLYKAKAPTDRDRVDFERLLPKLGAGARMWFAAALDKCHPGHEWRSAVVQ